ncbi:MAG: type IIL restriction-modification enzyme MmeI [Kiritimatiellia bacterium]
MRAALLAAAISAGSTSTPPSSSSLFQGVMDARERRQIGAHYHLESNILKLVRSTSFSTTSAPVRRHSRGPLRPGASSALTELQAPRRPPLSRSRVRLRGRPTSSSPTRDPRLELDILKELHRDNPEARPGRDDPRGRQHLSLIDVDQMYGIEIEEFPAHSPRSPSGWPTTR